MKLFCDTNVLIDYLGRREPFFEEALRLRVGALFGDFELWACTQSFVDAEYVLRHIVPVDTLRGAMSACLDFMHVAAPSAGSLSLGLRTGWPDLEDFLIAQCALESGAHFLITRDSKGFATSEVPVMSPSEFLTYAERELRIVYDLTEFEAT